MLVHSSNQPTNIWHYALGRIGTEVTAVLKENFYLNRI